MGNDESKPVDRDSGWVPEKAEKETSIFDACFGPRSGSQSAKGARLCMAPEQGDQKMAVKKTREVDKSQWKDNAEYTEEQASAANPNEHGNQGKKRVVTFVSSEENKEGGEEAENPEQEIRRLRRELMRLKERPSTRTLFMMKQNADQTNPAQALNEKDLEIANLKKDLCMSQIRAETALLAAKNAMNTKKLWDDHDDDDEEEEEEGGQQQAQQVDDNDETKKASKRDRMQRTKSQKKRDRDSLNMVTQLDQQLAENKLSLDEYALALSSLSAGGK